ncbi:MAG TPA: prepilin-type N-terminal cleavage/methylation domain-containing protein [Rhizomicrobium sp.]|nr:prepilin-type N-terminal cleavage/methylation domain-containing protein [Rhizomicrobium sp.]
MSQKQARSCHRGFTLLELLISITIFALILVALTSGLHFAGRAWDQQQQRDVRQGDVNAVQNVLRHMIASGRKFEGDQVTLKFVGTLPAALERGGLFDIKLALAEDRLVLSWQPHFKGPTIPSGQNKADLLKGVAGLDVGYYVAENGWQTVLDGKSKPAELVSIGLRFDDGRVWPDLVAAPMIREDSSKD